MDMKVIKAISESTGVLTTLFSMIGMTFASIFFWFETTKFTAENWLSALTICGGLIGGVVIKRTIDGTKLAKTNGNGANGNGG